jgi:hypothetical protein
MTYYSCILLIPTFFKSFESNKLIKVMNEPQLNPEAIWCTGKATIMIGIIGSLSGTRYVFIFFFSNCFPYSLPMDPE